MQGEDSKEQAANRELCQRSSKKQSSSMEEGAYQTDSTIDPLKKLVSGGLGRPVKQQGLTHAC